MMVRGRALQRFDDPEVLFAVARTGPTYVEIGTRWGGSALVAGLAGCEVYCIDPWDYPTKLPAYRSTPQAVRENWAALGLDPSRLHVFQQRHPPWPQEIDDYKFATGLIDGAHTEEQCRADWEAMRIRVMGYVLFHDIAKPAVRTIVEEGAAVPGWELATLGGKHQFGVLRRM